jgi:hypothetical protein
VKTDGLLVIRDLATTNGTKVKGQRVRWAALLPEDRISLGGYKLRIYLGSDEMPAPSEQRRDRGKPSAPPAALRFASTTVRGQDSLGRPPKDDTTIPAGNGRESALRAGGDSEFLGGGFEIIDDENEDEIIDLD